MIKKIVLGLILFTGLILHGADKAGDSENPSTVPSVEKEFYTGVYIYDYRMRTLAAEQGRSYSDLMDEHLAKLSSLGINAVYLGGVGSQNIDENLQLFQKHNIKLIPQLDFAYFQASWDDNTLETYAKNAAALINKYKGNPQIIAWSVKEEPAANSMDKLSVYYQKILELAPQTKFNLICDNIRAMKNVTKPVPGISGSDIYIFWWEVSAGGYWASPAFALKYLRGKAKDYADEISQRNSDFMLVLTADAMIDTSLANAISDPRKLTYIPEAQREAYIAKCKKFAADGRMGWGQFQKDGKTFYNVWKYYHPPANCTKAMIWTGIMTGAKSIYFWMYAPQTKADSEMTFERASYEVKGEAYIALGRDINQTGPELKEYSETIKELSPYRKIIANMTKLSETPVKSITKNIFNNAFAYPGINGKIVVLHNAEVGTWPDNDKIYIDSKGNLKDYKPFTDAVTALCEIAPARGEGVYDLVDGGEIKESEQDFNFVYPIKIPPGSGKFIFVGTKEQFLKLYKQIQH